MSRIERGPLASHPRDARANRRAQPQSRQRQLGERTVVAVGFAAATIAATLERRWFPRAWGEAGSLTSAFYYGDATRFVDYAIAILHGRTFDNGIPFHPPGWPLVLAGFLRVTGSGQSTTTVVPVAALHLFIACLGGLTVGMAALLAYEVAGPGAMLAVALLGTFHFGSIVEGTVANSEPLYGLLVVTATWAAHRWLRDGSRHRPAWAAVAGAIGGCAMLVRAEFLACAVVLVALSAWVRPRAWLRDSSVFLIMYCTMLVPTTVWHWRTLSAFNRTHLGRVAGPLPRFAPVTSYGPFNFAMANHAAADGGPNRDHPMLDRCNEETGERLSAGQLDLACPAIYDLYVNGYAIGARWIVGHPLDAASLMGKKIRLTAGFLAHGYLIDDVGPDVDGERRRVDLVDPERWLLAPIHGLLVLAGIIVLRRRPIALAVIVAPLVALLASVLLFYGYVRLGVAYLPVLWTLQSAAAANGLRRATGSGALSKRTVGFVLGTIAVLLIYEAARVDLPRAVMLDGERTRLGGLVQDEAVQIRRAR